MVRKRARTTDRAKWDKESMDAAIKDVTLNGKKLRESARAYGVPVSTLKDRIRSGNPEKLCLGRKPTFTSAQDVCTLSVVEQRQLQISSMVRKRARTTDRAKWDKESMDAAIKDVTLNGKKLRESARAYGVPVSTLKDRIRSGNPEKLCLGRKPTFTSAQDVCTLSVVEQRQLQISSVIFVTTKSNNL
ncbi:hypothetical protein J6590_006555 [Homalodisca vitripennis]|nr:hypothetical protein J6590_006555 [Homalodisca vitripennis]